MTGRGLPILSATAGVFALACVAAALVSIQYQPVLLSDAGTPPSIGVRLNDGKAFLSWRPGTPYRPPWAGQVNRFGFRYTRWSDGSGELGAPLWPASLAFATVALAAGLVDQRRRRRSTSGGLCPACGYDLRATPGRCPECGNATIPPGRDHRLKTKAQDSKLPWPSERDR